MEKSIKNKYTWYRDNAMIGTILLIVIFIMQIFAYLKVPVISSIHGYTVGMLFGFYNPFFYFFVAYLSLRLIFGKRIELPKWLKLNYFSFWFVALSIIFISASVFYHVNHKGFTAIGTKPWQSFVVWFKGFTSVSAWIPGQTNGGIVGVFMYSLVASATSGIGALIISIVLCVLTISLMLTGSFIGLYKNMRNKHILDAKEKQAKEKQETNYESIIDRNIENVPKEKPKVDNNRLPFEDPFL